MNFLMICADQFRADCLGIANRYPVRTPHLDALAREGICFRESYTALPSCCPARQSMLTGRRPEQLGAYWNYDITYPVRWIGPEEYSWAREFSARGYRTAYIGKWHVSPDHTPLDFGYETYVSESDILTEQNSRFPQAIGEVNWMGEPSPCPLEGSITHLSAERAVRFLRENGDRPFHLRLDFSDPHLPCRPSEPFCSLYRKEEVPRWAGFGDSFAGKPYIQRQMVRNWGNETRTWEDFSATVALYYGMISQVDDAIGRVLAALKECGRDRDTVVLFTSDHGDLCGSHQMMDKHYVLYDDVVRVPLILRIPGTEPSVCDVPVINSIDLAPTVCELFGFEQRAEFDGRSFAPGTGNRLPVRDAVVSTFNGQQFGLYTMRMIKCGSWKYIWNPTDVDELYDLEHDPGEHKNLADNPAYAQKLSSLRKRLYAELKAMHDPVLRFDWLEPQLTEGRKNGFRPENQA